MEITIKKLYKGCADVRDYVVKKCIDNQENCIIRYGNDRMVLSPKDLISKKVSESKEPMQSQYRTKPYKLYQYEWDPEQIDY